MDPHTNQSSFSQYGEDVLVLKHFAGKIGFFVEVGANDPELISQTFTLERQGWRGILVEPQSDCCEKIRRLRPLARLFQAACGAPEQRGTAKLQLKGTLSVLTPEGADADGETEEVRVMTLDDVLAEAGNPRVDFLSIDVEGFELQVLSGFNFEKHRPALMLIEDNFANRLQVHAYLKRHGYRLVKRTGCNNWYVPKGEPFALSTPWEKLKLFRKMYLGTAFRRLKNRLRGHPATA